MPARYELSRRTLLTGTAAAATAAALPALPATAAGPVDGTTLPRFGPACLTAAVVAMAVHGQKAYLVTRGIVPPSLVELDLATRRVVRTIEIPAGEGGWGITVADGKVFVGLYPVADVYCFDPADGSLAKVGGLAGAGGFVWDMATAPDGQVFAVSYPNGAVSQIDPATAAVTRLGAPVSGAQYGRYVGAADGMVYAGIYTPPTLVGYDRAAATFRDLTPESLRGRSFGPFATAAGRVYAGAGAALLSMAPDGSDPRVVPVPAGQSSVDALTVAADGTAYLTSRSSGSVWRCGPDDTAMTLVATPAPADEHRRLVLLDDTTLLGSSGSGALWWLDLGTGGFELYDLVSTGFEAQPDKPQSIASGGSDVYVGGHWVITQHRLPGSSTATSRRIRVGGEAKTLTVARGKLYSALYPSTEVVRIDPVTARVDSLGHLRHGQQRPWQAAYDEDSGLLAIASAPGTGALTGALSLLDTTTGELAVHPGVLPDQSVMTVSIADGVAYLGGDVIGGGGIPPTRASASIAAFDLRTRSVLWSVQPIAGERSVQSVAVVDGIAYVVMKRTSGTWFAYDLATRTVVARGKLSGYGQIFVAQGRIFCETNFGGNLYRLGPDLQVAEHLAYNLGNDWYTVPQLAPNRSGPAHTAWGLAGRDLAKVPLR